MNTNPLGVNFKGGPGKNIIFQVLALIVVVLLAQNGWQLCVAQSFFPV